MFLSDLVLPPLILVIYGHDFAIIIEVILLLPFENNLFAPSCLMSFWLKI